VIAIATALALALAPAVLSSPRPGSQSANLSLDLFRLHSAAPVQDAPVAAPSVTESGDVEGADEYLAAVQADVKHEAKH